MFVICLASSGMMNTPMWRHRAAPSFPKSERLWMQSHSPQNLKSWGWRLKAIYFIGWSIYVFPLVLTVNEPWRFENSKVTEGIWWNLDLEQRDWGVIRPMMRQLSFGMRCVSFPWFWVLPTIFVDSLIRRVRYHGESNDHSWIFAGSFQFVFIKLSIFGMIIWMAP